MAEAKEDLAEAPVRFKRRKVNHPRRSVFTHDEENENNNTTTSDLPPNAPSPSENQETEVPNLAEILRNRKTPRDRLREAARKAEQKTSALVHVNTETTAPRHPYEDRFVAQTGQVVAKDDQQMNDFVDARIAEENFRKFGWPIPKHLEHIVEKYNMLDIGDKKGAEEEGSKGQNEPEKEKPKIQTPMAAGLGKLQEIDLGPEATARNIERTEKAKRRLEGIVEPEEEQPQKKVRLGRDGKPQRRWQKRRNSEDLRRDAMVEAVLSESKLEYFEEDKPAAITANDNQDADDALAEQFRREFLESMDARNRKPAPPPGVKGAKEQPKGPKLGGSRSARAAMRLQEEQAAKNKR